MIDNTTFVWRKTADARTRDVRLGLSLVVVFTAIAILCAVTGYLFLAAAMAVMTLVSGPVIAPARGRVTVAKDAVVARPRAALLNTHYVFPTVTLIAAVLITMQWVVTEPTGGDVRLPFVTVLFWLAVLVTAGTTIRYRGALRLSTTEFGIPGRCMSPYSGADFTLVQEKKSSFPHLEVMLESGPKLLFFPTKYYGLEANSLYSTLRHLAETDEETRRNYSPELIREMLLFTPDREVEVGESIEVRIVAQPQASTA
ncbi:hypothetical protein [Williamsia serinedens]|uniref:Uncharacterized protein n=1 Tax=Williamsia serinedens TaxID=391736 RepID=A0ABT1H0K0_9NOCA|nr:hypothetical protein [Williamsia serinedens]MBE7195580.1 hypothetical protein [Gordonia polyisoprenivorans]MCP2160775.1 hypothetical protein [Williamsia serinedens]